MKTFASLALIGAASATSLAGYTIDLCPDAIGTKALGEQVYLPGNEENLILGNIWARERLANIQEEQRLANIQQQRIAGIQQQQEVASIQQKLGEYQKLAQMKELYRMAAEQQDVTASVPVFTSIG